MIAPIPDWPGYYVTSGGIVVSFWRQQFAPGWRGGARPVIGDDGRELASFDRKRRDGTPSGYRSVCLSLAGRRRNVYVHHIVLFAFVGPRPSTDHEACHKNDRPGDDRLDNLYWGTKARNVQDRHETGSFSRAWTTRYGGAFADLVEGD